VSFPLLAPFGTPGAPSYSFSGDADTGIYRNSTAGLGVAIDGFEKLLLDSFGLNVTDALDVAGTTRLRDDTQINGDLAFSPDNLYDIGTAAANRPRSLHVSTDLDAGGPATPGALHIHRVGTPGATNFERCILSWGTSFWSSTSACLLTDQGGTGVSRDLIVGTSGPAGLLRLVTGNVARWGVDSNGHLYSENDGTYDIGLPNTSRVRNIYLWEALGQFMRSSTPANPSAGSLKLYPKTDGNYYKLNSAGVETLVGGATTFTHTQGPLAAVWTITHNLNRFPSVTVIDSGNSVIIPDVHYDSANQVTVSFGAATSGKAYLN